MAAPKKAEVQEALRLITEGMHPYAAAKAAGANRFSVYSALRKAAPKQTCPACGSPLKPGQAPQMPEPEVLALRPAMAGVRAAVTSRDAVTRSVIERELRALLAQLEGGN